MLIQRIHQFDVRSVSGVCGWPSGSQGQERAGRARLGLQEPSTAVICPSVFLLVRFRGEKVPIKTVATADKQIIMSSCIIPWNLVLPALCLSLSRDRSSHGLLIDDLLQVDQVTD